MKVLSVLLIVILSKGSWSQDDEGPYRGKLIGKLNSYHHQTSGEVYAVDENTLLLVNFNYDGMGDDTFFWAGDSGRPGPQGFIIPDEHGKTNILERYLDAEIRLSLPEGKRISRLAWFAVYDIGTQSAFADVFVPDDVDAPRPRTLPPLAGTSAVTSGPVKILDARTILISALKYDGSGTEVYFLAGAGPAPNHKGHKIPDEYGYIEPLSRYSGVDVRLQLPGALSVLEVGWLAVYDVAERRSLAAVLLRDQAAVPPSTAQLHNYVSALPSCRQLHRRLQVSWDVFGEQLTLQIAAMMGEQEYAAFGISGSKDRSTMLGADVAIVSYDSKAQRGYVDDYNITAKAPCVKVLDRWLGVCRDSAVGFLSSLQLMSSSREAGLTVVTYRRQLQASESIDLSWPVDRPAYVVWALGPLFSSGEPAYHHLWHRSDLTIMLTNNPPENDCVPFNIESPPVLPRWESPRLDPALRSFTATLGPASPRARHAAATPPLVLYINGHVAPNITLTRGLLYEIKVLCGSDPHSATHYHPVVVETVEGRPLAGYTAARRNRQQPTAAGSLCLSSLPEGVDPRRVSAFSTFRAFNRSLVTSCPDPKPATLKLAPANDWPDTVLYKSYTQPGMGGFIFVVDRNKRSSRTSAADAGPAAGRSPLVLIAIATLHLVQHKIAM